MKINRNEITLFFDGKDSLGKKTLAYTLALSQKVNRQDLNKQSISTTTLKTILMELGLEPKQIMNKSHPYYQGFLRGKDYDSDGWLTILQKNPMLIKGPIVMFKGKVLLCESPFDVFRVAN